MEAVLAVAAATWGVAMAVSPLLQVRRILREGSSAGVSLGYYAVLLVGFALWVLYGVASANAAIIVPNLVALVIHTFTVVVARRYRGAPTANASIIARTSSPSG